MNVKMFYQDYKLAIWLTVIMLPMAGVIGGLAGFLSAVVLSMMEISLSADNAVVNAKELQTMDEIWRRRFIIWGILIAVFVMRGLFPIFIVSIVGDMSIWEAAKLTVSDPEKYAHHIESSIDMVAGFGAAFLGMVWAHFFIDKEKDVHWVPVIETIMTFIGKYNVFNVFHAILVLGLMYFIQHHYHLSEVYFQAAIVGVLTYGGVQLLKKAVSKDENGQLPAAFRWMSVGLAQFLYLEVLDASFSFDGVIGAFAITTNIFIILIGLGIGAIWVREMTVVLVKRNTINEYRYLEHGAFWAIGVLAVVLGLAPEAHLPEWVAGGVGITLLVIAIVTSIMWKRKNGDLPGDVVND